VRSLFAGSLKPIQIVAVIRSKSMTNKITLSRELVERVATEGNHMLWFAYAAIYKGNPGQTTI
jgi:hypothetical protein